jgi:hypothetical protein
MATSFASVASSSAKAMRFSAKIRWCCGVIGWAGAPGGFGSSSCVGTCSRAGGAGGRSVSRAMRRRWSGARRLGRGRVVGEGRCAATRRAARHRNSHPAAITIAASASASATTRRLEVDLSARKMRQRYVAYLVNVHVTVCVEFFQAFRWQYQPEGALGWHAESLYRTQLSSGVVVRGAL